MKVVLDASVVVKWLVPESPRETDVMAALRLLADLRAGRVTPIQPPHWLAEVAAVITRLRPEATEPALDLLDALELPVADDPALYRRASQLAATLGHHLFDTLYHAVALELGALLVTADEQYEKKARHLGGVVLLGDWDLTQSSVAEGRAAADLP